MNVMNILMQYLTKICWVGMLVVPLLLVECEIVEPIVEIQQGKLRGKIGTDYKGGEFYSFEGIPYAKPPVGDLRFKAPVPPESWEGVRDATKAANGCLGKHFHFVEKLEGSEDCLHLNVYTPELPDEKNSSLKHVMFWIHGGGFKFGPSGPEINGPEYLITGDIVLVTISYRLGILGLLRLEDPSLGVPGNAGFKDMVMALKWVHTNIEKFGGDPNNVTIFGESAGSAAVHGLILSPMGKDLFHRAIMQSGTIFDSWVCGGEKASTVAKVLGNDIENEKDVLELLQSVPAEKILEAQDKITDDFSWTHIRPFGMVVEKNNAEPAFLPDNPLNIINSGNYNKVPIIIGHTSNESLYFLVVQNDLVKKLASDKNFENKLPYYLNVSKGTELASKIADKIEETYYGEKRSHLSDLNNYLTLSGDIMGLRGIYMSANLHLKNLGYPIYIYIFSADTDMNLIKKLNNLNTPGASHADELGYLFKTTLIPSFKENSLEELVVSRVVKLWTNFAKVGNPTPEKSDPLLPVEWKPIQKDHFDSLDIGNELKFIKNPEVERLKVWHEIHLLIANSTKASTFISDKH